MNKKILKNLIFVISLALLLLAATLAWFATFDTAVVNSITSSITGNVDVKYEEFDGENWVDINSQSTVVGKMVPGEEHRYRAVITAGDDDDVMGYSVSLDGITVTDGDNSEYDVRAYTYVRSYIVEGDAAPPEELDNYEFASYIGAGVESIDVVKVGYFGGSVDEDPTEDETTDDTDDTTDEDESTTESSGPKVVIKAGEKVTVYYSIMLQGEDIPEHNEISNATLKIGKVNVILMYTDSIFDTTTTEPTTKPEAEV